MDYSFEKCFSTIIETSIYVEIEEGLQKRIKTFVEELIKAKQKESHHQRDNQKEFKRFYTGYLGEAALEKVFNLPIIDWTIGESSSYHIPDIPGYGVGIKTVEYGKFPIVFKNNNYPQIICVINPGNHSTVCICGLATTDVLNTYQDDSLIIDPLLRARGTKTGFYGFEHLLPVSSIEDLEPYKKTQARRLTSYANMLQPAKRGANKQCPKCGQALIVRDGKYGTFWGCSSYPKCRYTENFK